MSTDDPFFDGAFPSGIEPLDALLGALVPGRIHVICGTTGTAKTIAALQFVYAAVAERSTALLLTQDDAADISALGRYLGLRLGDAVRAGQLTILRCRGDFARRYRQAASPNVFDYCTRRGVDVPTRIAVVPSRPMDVSHHRAAGGRTRAVLIYGATSLSRPGDVARR